MARLEVRGPNKLTSNETPTLIIVAQTQFESAIMANFFGDQVGEDGLIFSAPVSLRVKLSDGFAEHYMSIQKMVEASTREEVEETC